MTGWIWINFVDVNVNLGIVVIRESDVASKISSLDPGGRIFFMRIPASWGDPPEAFRDRLLTYREANELSLAWTGTGLANGHGELAN